MIYASWSRIYGLWFMVNDFWFMVYGHHHSKMRGILVYGSWFIFVY